MSEQPLVDYQVACAEAGELPEVEAVEKWATLALSAINRDPQPITVRVVDEAEITRLNYDYRGKNQPTNVLAFPYEPMANTDYYPLGDIVVCYSVVKNESKQQDITVSYHYAHMVIHGILHLCGLDHQTDQQAAQMEAVEQGILAQIDV